MPRCAAGCSLRIVSCQLLNASACDSRKSAPVPADSAARRKAVWTEQIEGQWMFVAHVENAMKSRESTLGSTGEAKQYNYLFILMRRFSGGCGVRS